MIFQIILFLIKKEIKFMTASSKLSPYPKHWITTLSLFVFLTTIINPHIGQAKPTIQPRVQPTEQPNFPQASSLEYLAKVVTTDVERYRPKKRVIKKKKEWYGGQIILTEFLDLVYFVPYFFVAPLVHIANGQSGNAARSFLMRLGLPVLGFALGAAVSDKGTGFFKVPIMGVFLGLVGIVTAIIYDIAVISYKTVEYKKFGIITPTIGEPTPRVLGFEQTPMLNMNFTF